jgi:hypothetical protein
MSKNIDHICDVLYMSDKTWKNATDTEQRSLTIDATLNPNLTVLQASELIG